jgi:predicted MFS family arabinose efflux permease
LLNSGLSGNNRIPAENLSTNDSTDLNGATARAAMQTAPVEETVSPQLPARALRLPRMLQAFRHRNFLYFWTGNLLSNIGTWMQSVAQGWLVLQLASSNSAFWLGMVGFASSSPMLVFTLIGGVIADRVNRRRLLMLTQSSMMVFALVLAALTYSRIVTIPHIMLLAFANGLAMSVNMPAYQAMISTIVPKEDLTNAVALNSAQYNMSRVVGPALGGFTMVWLSIAGNFLLNAVSFLAVIIALMRIHYPVEPAANGASLWDDLTEGFRYVFENRVMTLLLTVVALASIFGVPYIIFVPLFARDILHLHERGLGLLMGASGLGALIGAVTMAHTGVMHGRGKLVVRCSVVFFTAIILFSFSRWPVVSAGLVGIIGGFMVLTIANVNALLQHLCVAEMRGRVMSLYTTMFLGFAPLGSLLAGTLAGSIGAPYALAGMAAFAMVATLVLYACKPELRALD